MTDEEITKEFDLIHEMDLEMARLEKIVNYLRETLNDFSSERLFTLKRLINEYDLQKNKNIN